MPAAGRDPPSPPAFRRFQATRGCRQTDAPKFWQRSETVNTNPFVELVDISKSFPGVKALSDVSIAFYPGKVHVLLGENGAGKYTIIKIISSSRQ